MYNNCIQSSLNSPQLLFHRRLARICYTQVILYRNIRLNSHSWIHGELYNSECLTNELIEHRSGSSTWLSGIAAISYSVSVGIKWSDGPKKRQQAMERRRRKTQQLEYWYRCNDPCMRGGCGSNANLALVPLQVELKQCKTKAIH